MKGNAAILANRIPAAPDAAVDGLLQKTVPETIVYSLVLKDSYFGAHNSGSTDFRGGWDPIF